MTVSRDRRGTRCAERVEVSRRRGVRGEQRLFSNEWIISICGTNETGSNDGGVLREEQQ